MPLWTNKSVISNKSLLFETHTSTLCSKCLKLIYIGYICKFYEENDEANWMITRNRLSAFSTWLQAVYFSIWKMSFSRWIVVGVRSLVTRALIGWSGEHSPRGTVCLGTVRPTGYFADPMVCSNWEKPSLFLSRSVRSLNGSQNIWWPAWMRTWPLEL